MIMAVLIASMSAVQDAPKHALAPEVVLAHVSGEQRGEGVERLQSAFEARNPGYRVQVHMGSEPLDAVGHAVTFVQSEGTVSIDGADALEVRVGDIVLQRPGHQYRFSAPMELVSFILPQDQELDAGIPALVRPDFDPKLTDRPGGCATDPGAYRRLLLTWNPERGPYVHHGFNCHRVRIDDSFSHYHPVDGGFDEFYLVQEAPEGAVLVVSRRTQDLLADRVERDDVAELLERLPLKAGQLIMIPRGVTHRGHGGAVIQVLAVPGFLPGKEIPMDDAIRRVNGRFALTGARALPVHDTLPSEPETD